MKDVQPEISIGLVGHVDHGKTTLVRAFSGKWTDTHSEELKRGITIKLGYADASFFKCEKCKKYGLKEKCSCGGKAKLLRKISFVDAPGHESLMATMLSGAAIMDGAILMISANEDCPQLQTREHLMALQISGIKNIVIVQNKIDTVTAEQAIDNHKQILKFIKGTDYEKSPIIPISAQQEINMDALIEALEKTIPTPKRDPKANPVMYIARSFDINKPGSEIESLLGGVLGGAIKQGVFKVGDEIEIKPGISVENKSRKEYKSLKTTITGLKVASTSVKEVHPGGTVGVLTSLDPKVVSADSLTGNVIGVPGKLPKVYDSLTLKIHLLDRVVGTNEDMKVENISISETLMLNCNASATVGVVNTTKKGKIECTLKLPICAETGDQVTISRRVGNRFRLIGYGLIE